MSIEKLKIDFVAPPFAGHLFPMVQLAQGLVNSGLGQARIISTASARHAVASASLPFVEILSGQDNKIWSIVNTPKGVRSNPIKLWRQLQENLGLLHELKDQLARFWDESRPDLVIVDSVVPVAGLTAHAKNIRWWTGTTTPCAVESATGVPSYVGGWKPRNDFWGRVRDPLGRGAVRLFKLASSKLFRKPLKRLGFASLYRSDGTEAIYSPECILAYAIREFEFERSWPDGFHFIGPLPRPPEESNGDFHPVINPARPTILISLGTHLNWAKQPAIDLIRKTAARLPEFDFHFTLGKPNGNQQTKTANFSVFDFVPYTEQLRNYSAIIHHGGTGVLYAALTHAIPSLVWPQDYDQFDHAARLTHHNLAYLIRPRAELISDDLKRLVQDDVVADQLQQFQQIISEYSPTQQTLRLLDSIDAH